MANKKSRKPVVTDPAEDDAFGSQMRMFVENLTGLREFLELVSQFLDDTHNDFVRQNRDDLAPLISAISLIVGKDEKFQKLLTSEQTKAVEEYVIEKQIDTDTQQSAIIKSKTEAAARRFGKAMEGFTKTLEHKNFLLKSCLMALVSTVEWFFAQVLHGYYKTHAEILAGDRQFTYQELQSFSSLEDARNAMIEAKVESILRDSFPKWITLLRNTAKLSMGYLDDVEDHLAEIFLRRNIVVHNGGVANATYLAKVASSLKAGRKPGDVLFVTPAYLSDAIDLLEQYFVLIAAELWKQQVPKDKSRGRALVDLAYDKLVAGKWRIAGGWSYFLMNDKQVPELEQLIGKMNYWQTKKWIGEFPDVEVDVKNADFSAVDRVFRLCQLALLDDQQGFIKMVRQCLRTKDLSLQELAEWPIFKEMRTHKQVAAILSKTRGRAGAHPRVSK